jgi:hypothetical protein
MTFTEYYWMAAALGFVGCITTPSKSLSPWDQLWTSVVLALLLGWLLWPFALIGSMRTAQRGGR